MEEPIHTHLNSSTILASSSSLSFAKNFDSIFLTGKNWLSLHRESLRCAHGQHVVHRKSSPLIGQSCPKLLFDHRNSFLKAPLQSFHPPGSITSKFNHFHALLCLICQVNYQILLLLGFTWFPLFWSSNDELLLWTLYSLSLNLCL